MPSIGNQRKKDSDVELRSPTRGEFRRCGVDPRRHPHPLHAARPGRAARRVVLIHSLAMDRTFWQPVADLLPEAVGADLRLPRPRRVGQARRTLHGRAVRAGSRRSARPCRLAVGAGRGRLDGRLHLDRLRGGLSDADDARSACSTPPPGMAPRRRSNGRSAPTRRWRRGWRRWSISRPRAGSATPSGRAIPTWSSNASTCSCATT